MESKPRVVLGLLFALAIVSWAVAVANFFRHRYDLMIIANAVMFTSMLIAWPLLTGRRVRAAHVERAAMCRECRSYAWPSEFSFGFCIHCGSTKMVWPSPG